MKKAKCINKEDRPLKSEVGRKSSRRFFSYLVKDLQSDVGRLASIPLTNPNPITDITKSGDVIFMNPVAQKLMPSLKKKGHDHQWLINWDKISASLMTSSRPLTREIKIGNRYYSQIIYYIKEIKNFRIYGTDITEQKKKQEELKKLNHVLETLNLSNKAMLRATDEHSYVKQVCAIIVSICKHSMVWIGYAENDDKKTVRPVAYSGFEKGYINKLAVTWDSNSPLGNGPVGATIRTKKPVSINTSSDPNFMWKIEALKRGYKSILAIPICYGDRSLGAIAIYNDKQNAFSDEEIDLLKRLSDDLAYGITALRFREEREKSAEQKRLLELEQMRTQFIADATHELRTPLAIIKGNIDLTLMSGQKVQEDTRSSLKDIDHEVHHISELLSDLSMITSKGERRQLISNTINVRDLLKECVRRSKTLAYPKNITISCTDLEDILIIGDEEYLEKAFVNVIKNAITYGKPNGKIEISSDSDTDYVRISFRDNGIGISDENIPRIFERFFRVDKARTRSNGRTGLGLSIVKWIIEAHGGHIQVKSELNRGSTFIISLPINKKMRSK